MEQVAQAVKHLRLVLRVELRASGDGGLDIRCAEGRGVGVPHPTSRRTTSRLKALIHDHYFACLVEQPSQEATIECVSLDKASSKWIFTGEGCASGTTPSQTEPDWASPLRNRPCGPSAGISECRPCGSERETPSHVLSRCRAKKGWICRRHDAVVSRLVGSLDARKRVSARSLRTWVKDPSLASKQIWAGAIDSTWA